MNVLLKPTRAGRTIAERTKFELSLVHSFTNP